MIHHLVIGAEELNPNIGKTFFPLHRRKTLTEELNDV